MRLALVGGTSNARLADGIARRLDLTLTARTIETFPDGEIGVTLEGLRGADVYVIESTGPSVHDHLAELLLLADAARRSGAARLTAVIPYLAYARQDRREREGQAIGARVVAEVISRFVDRAIVVDLHTSAVEGFFDCAVEQLTAIGVLADHVRPLLAGHVVVAPDLGAVKRAERFARILGLGVAMVRKRRLSGREVEATAVEGDVRGHPVLIVDDMVSTGATIEAAVHALDMTGATGAILAATHGLLVPPAVDRLRTLALHAAFVTDSVPPPDGARELVTEVTIAGLLSDAIARLHRDEPLAELVDASS